MSNDTKAAPSAQQAAGSIDTPEFSSLLGELHAGYQYGPTNRYGVAHTALIEHITEWAGRPAATPAQPIAPPTKPEPMTTDEAREFLIGFMNEHFTDRTFHRYIRGERDAVSLAGDFAWQMATALRRIGAAPCAMCNGAGSVGHAPDGYFDCPECTAPAAQPIAVSAPTDEQVAEICVNVRPGSFTDCDGDIDYFEYDGAVVRAFLAARAAAPVSGPSEPPKPVDQQLARFAIDGAICHGRTGFNKPPTDDHWLMEYWQIGRQLAKLGETSAWDNVTPVDPAAPVSGQGASSVKTWQERLTFKATPMGLIEDAMIAEIADLRAALDSRPRSPEVSGQGATIDTPAFRKLLADLLDNAEYSDERYQRPRDALVQFIDSRPRSEDSRKIVATVIKRGADRQWMSEALGNLPDGSYSLCLASTTPQKANNE